MITKEKIEILWKKHRWTKTNDSATVLAYRKKIGELHTFISFKKCDKVVYIETRKDAIGYPQITKLDYTDALLIAHQIKLLNEEN